jgi:hypothetical protein
MAGRLRQITDRSILQIIQQYDKFYSKREDRMTSLQFKLSLETADYGQDNGKIDITFDIRCVAIEGDFFLFVPLCKHTYITRCVDAVFLRDQVCYSTEDMHLESQGAQLLVSVWTTNITNVECKRSKQVGCIIFDPQSEDLIENREAGFEVSFDSDALSTRGIFGHKKVKKIKLHYEVVRDILYYYNLDYFPSNPP